MRRKCNLVSLQRNIEAKLKAGIRQQNRKNRKENRKGGAVVAEFRALVTPTTNHVELCMAVYVQGDFVDGLTHG